MQESPSTASLLANQLICPVCREPLSSNDHTHWRCENNHSFDRARQGYLNLLLAHKKRSKAPGDSLDMVNARQRLLNSGVYQPISDQLNQAVLNSLTDHQSLQLCDVGCGEGYYTRRLTQALSEQGHANYTYGVDISKDAVRAAAQKDKQQNRDGKQTEWLVASGADLPFRPMSMDAITCLFTRLMPEGFARVLKPQAQVFTLNTGPAHLREMREILYPQVKDSYFNPTTVMGNHGFFCTKEQPLSYQIELTHSQQINDLLTMTPHAWKASQAARDRLRSYDRLTVTVDIVLHQFAQTGKDK